MRCMLGPIDILFFSIFIIDFVGLMGLVVYIGLGPGPRMPSSPRMGKHCYGGRH